MERVLTATRLSPDQHRQVLDLLDAAHDLDCARLNDHLKVDLTQGPRDGFRAVLLYEDHGTLAGYGQASTGNGGFVIDGIVPSAYDGDPDAALADLLRHLLEHLPAGSRVTWWAHPDSASRAIATTLGMQPDRQLLMMEAELPVEVSTDVEVRPFQPGTDDEAWLRVNNAAFAAHGEQGGWDLSMLRQRQAEDWFDPNGFLLHEREGRLAAFCWVKMHAADDDSPLVGEIYVVAVHPDFHGLGLGRDLTVAGLHYMSAQGAVTAMLYVDATNNPAVGLYRSLGFETAHTEQSYLRPARS